MPDQLAKKYRTFDSDLSQSVSSEPAGDQLKRPTATPATPQTYYQQSVQISATKARNNINTSNIDNCYPTNPPGDPNRNNCAETGVPWLASSCRTGDPIGSNQTPTGQQQRQQQQSNSPCLSKLVLSNSLHQLADTNFYTTNNNSTYNYDRQLDRINMNSNAAHLNAIADHDHDHDDDDDDNDHHDNRDADDDDDPQQQTDETRHHAPHLCKTTNLNDQQSNTNERHENALSTPTGALPNHCQNVTPSPATNQQQQQHQQQSTPNSVAVNKRTNYNNQQKQHKKRDANLDTVHVIVGNESCDLDSAVSCLLMFHVISKMSDEINGKDKTRTLYIPLLNTTRDMLDTKCEVLWFLQKTLSIDKSFLTCKDDIDWTEIKRNGVEVLITLVDHNYNEEFKDIGKVVEIIDHHQVQNAEWLMENQAQIRLTLDASVGSCTTLVAERLFYIYAEHHVSDEILMLIYGTVLLDTICLSEKAKRFTRRDVYLLKKLDYLLGNKRPVRDELYKQLVEVKNSTRELNFEKLMKRDLKVYRDKRGMRVGIASLFGMAAKEALGLAANIDLDQFFQQNHYEAFLIMGLIADLDHSDSISRDLVLISANNRLFERLCQALELDTSKLDLVPISGSDSSPDPEDNVINKKKIVDSSSMDCCSSSTTATNVAGAAEFSPFYKARIWQQRNVTSSRKVVAPLVLKVLHDGAQ